MAEHNSVFISYRRTASAFITLAVYQELQKQGIDCFFDLEDIPAGRFDTTILNQIGARPYFMPILTPGTLDRCKEAGDWVLKEYEEAVRLKRVFVPLHTPDFNFDDIDQFLPPAIAEELKHANAVEIPARFFKYAIQDVRERLLKPIPLPVREVPESDFEDLARKQELANSASPVTEEELEKYYSQRIQQDEFDAQIDYYQDVLAKYQKGEIQLLAGSTKTFVKRSQIALARAYINRGTRRIEEGDIAGAIADYTEGLKFDPDNPDFVVAYVNRAKARAQKQDLNGAIEDYSKAIELDPSLTLAHLNRGLTYYDKENFTAAITNFNEVIRLDPQNVPAYNSRGLARRNLGDHDGAIADHSKAIELDPSHHRAYYNRAHAYMMANNLEAAMSDYDTVIRLNPRHASSYFYRGLGRAELGDLEGALSDLDNTLRLEPNWSVYAARAQLKGQLTDLEGALADLNEAIRLAPNVGQLYVDRGRLHLDRNDDANAEADFMKLLEVEPNHPIAVALKKQMGQ